MVFLLLFCFGYSKCTKQKINQFGLLPTNTNPRDVGGGWRYYVERSKAKPKSITSYLLLKKNKELILFSLSDGGSITEKKGFERFWMQPSQLDTLSMRVSEFILFHFFMEPP